MRKGTTPTLVMVLDTDTALLKNIYVTLRQGAVTITKTGDAIVRAEDGCSISVTLTQAETLGFKGGTDVLVQVRATTAEGKAVATNIASTPVESILQDGEII